MAQILIVDDEIGIRELLSEILADEGHTVRLAENATQAREQRQRERPDLVLLDIWMPDSDGITLLKEWSASGQLTMPVIMMSGHGSIETAVEATRIGAMDFLEKPIALQKLLSTVKRGLRHQDAPAAAPMLLGVGRSPALADARKRLAQLAGSGASILLRGERGTHPELFGHMLRQPNTPWMSAMGAITDAPAAGGPDVLAQAAGGILFIDDIAALSRNQQKNLAFLAARAGRAKVRLVAFSSEPPQTLVGTHGWDAALVARLSELVFSLPSLREYAEDIPEIAKLMLARLVESRACPARQFSTAALNQLRQFSWPGNLDDLSSAVRNLALSALGEEIGTSDVERVLPHFLAAPAPGAGMLLDQPLREAREAFERAYFEHHLALENGSIARVAEKSGLERTHLYRKLKALGIHGGRKDEQA